MTILSRLLGKAEPQVAPQPSSEDLVALRNTRIDIGKGLHNKWKKDSYDPCPPQASNPHPDLKGQIPEIDAADITLETLAGAIRHHGALIVRGLMDKDEAADLRADIDSVMQKDAKALKSSKDEALFSIPKDVPVQFADVAFAIECGSIFTFMSPRISDKLLRYFERISLRSILQSYFNEEPCVSFKKSVLRRVEPKDGTAEWHQDGAFMTEEIASLNVWMALTECGPGTGAPGMKFVPKRLENVIEETGKNGAYMDWSVSQKTVDEKYTGDEAEVSPHFNEGDAIFFDHLNLHATATGPEFTKTRYAIETWFFASSRHAENQISVAWT